MENIAVLGGGSFGTVLACITGGNGHRVRFWMRNAAAVAAVNSEHENPGYLPGCKLPDDVTATEDMAQAVQEAGIIFVAVPSASFRSVVKKMRGFAPPDAILISTTKGIEAGSFLLMSQILAEESPAAPIGVLSGPNLAKEIAAGHLTGSVIASDNEEVRRRVMEALKSKNFRVYVNDDMFGVELGGSLKNIYAIIAGMAEAIGMGFNTNSMLVTRALAEMARFGSALGADPMTFLGLAGVGDLVVTCSTPLSRNYRIGQALGRGKSIEEAMADLAEGAAGGVAGGVAEGGQMAEGVNTVKLVTQKAAELEVYMPLATGLYRVIYEGEAIPNMISALMLGEQALDVEFAAVRRRGG